MVAKLRHHNEQQDGWKRRPRSAQRISLACLVLGLIALSVILLTTRSNRSIDKITPLPDAETTVELANRTDVSSSTESEPPADVIVREVGVLGGPCIAGTGEGEAYGIATSLMLNIDAGPRFQVLDDSGTLFEGTLPFYPQKSRLGRSENGSVLAGYGSLYSDEHSSTVENPGIVRLYLDGQLEYATENAIDFGVAHDASAFFTIEREFNGSYVMKIRQLQPRFLSEYTLDLGDQERNRPVLPYRWSFSQDNSDVILPSPSPGAPTRLLPVGGGEPVEFPARLKVNSSPSLETFFSSRQLAYHRVPDPENNSRQWLVKVRYDWQGDVPIERMIWKQQIGSRSANWIGGVCNFGMGGPCSWSSKHRIRLSDDHRYVLLDGEVLRVLDAETGDIVLAYPTDVPAWEDPMHARRDEPYFFGDNRVYYGERARDFLATVEYPDEVMYPERTRFPSIVGSKLIIEHHVLRGGSLDCRTVPEVEYHECVRAAREQLGARYMWVWDVLQLDDMQAGHTSVQRIPLQVPGAGCSERVVGDLKVENGSLRFFPISAEE